MYKCNNGLVFNQKVVLYLESPPNLLIWQKNEKQADKLKDLSNFITSK